MINEFDEVMAQRTNAELLTILNSADGDYKPAALEAAKRVFDSRNLSDQQVVAVKQKIFQKDREDLAKANEPLAVPYKILTFIFPGVIQLMFSGTFYADGYDRKARELKQWTLYGYGFYGSLVLLFFLLQWSFSSKRLTAIVQ